MIYSTISKAKQKKKNGCIYTPANKTKNTEKLDSVGQNHPLFGTGEQLELRNGNYSACEHTQSRLSTKQLTQLHTKQDP